MEKINVIRIIFLLGIAVLILAACGSGISSTPKITDSPLAVATTQKPFNITATVSPTKRVSRPSQTPTLTLNSTQQTQFAIYNTERAVSNQLWNDKATKVAQFPEIDTVTCGIPSSNAMVNSSEISPDENWVAVDCSDNQTLIVQNKEGIKWTLDFKDFLSPNSPDGMPGGMNSKFWSPDGEYLYFTTWLGYSGGGNDCFPRFLKGDYGLFRLNLKNGSWVTLIPPTDGFPGYGIRFSPTGRRYATDINGVIITDINTGEFTKIDVPDTIESLEWSPDGAHLAYSVASCGEQSVQSSSVYVWDALTNQTQLLFTTNEILLRYETWIDNSTLRVEGEKIVDLDTFYTIYVFDITQNSLVFSGTATPYP